MRKFMLKFIICVLGAIMGIIGCKPQLPAPEYGPAPVNEDETINSSEVSSSEVDSNETKTPINN